MQGSLSKMRVELASPVNYYLPVGDQEIPMNPLIGCYIKLAFTGQINCTHCDRPTKKSFSQGYCYPCMLKLAQCDMCMMKPETCHYHLGTCREPEWAQKVCFSDHFVYLANTSGLKVGITRSTQIPTRWIDQGATQAMTLFKVDTRQQSGFIEVAFKELVADKTNWRAILKGNADSHDLVAEGKRLKDELNEKLDRLISSFGDNKICALDAAPVEIRYPVTEYPSKIVSHNFDKKAAVEGTLQGIKGQYLIFDSGVINIRKFTGYQIKVSF